VAHHENVGGHGAQVGDGVKQDSRPWLALERAMSRLITSADRRLAAISKRGPGARAVLEEQIEHCFCRAASGTFFTSRLH